MRNNTQLERYKKLLAFIDQNLKEEINIEKVEEVVHYSYRNINRIFEALHHETIGKYIKRLRLEKAAQYLKYSDMGVSEIAYEVGFEERASFSKAFKSKFGCSPVAFRNSNEAIWEMARQSMHLEEADDRIPLQFEIEIVPEFSYLFLEYRGDYTDAVAIEKAWDQLTEYAISNNLVSESTIFMTEILDDNEISDTINSRYNFAFILDQPLTFEPAGLFRTKVHQQQKYAKFTHQGSHESSADFYNEIYAFWMLDVGLELADFATFEFYPNYDENIAPDKRLTEVYIPVR